MAAGKVAARIVLVVVVLLSCAARSAVVASEIPGGGVVEELTGTGHARLEMLDAIKPWSAGQLHPGEQRAPQKGADPLGPKEGRIHIGTHEFYRDSDGVRSIDKVLSSYIQGICTDFLSEDQTSCEASGYNWYTCPEDFPHADSAVRVAKVHIPVCYTRHKYAEEGKGPPKSWCVPSHLISSGPRIADWIDQGLGVVCDRKERGRVDREEDEAAKWRAKAERYKQELQGRQSGGGDDSKLRAELREEKRKDKEWRHLANAYKRQVEDDRDSAKVAVDQLQDALADMQQQQPATASRQSSSSSSPLAANVQGPRCDSPAQYDVGSDSACRYVKRQCRQRGGLFNYLTLPYCSLPAIPYFAVVVLLVWVAILFIWMANAANAFLCPALLVIADLTKMGEDVAGVTLLALGNGAGDVASVVAATVAAKHGSQMAVGEVLGSSLFVSGAILGLVTLSTSAPSAPTGLIRDLSFLLGAVLWVLWVLHDSYISIWESIGFVLLYGAYLFFVLTSHFDQVARGKGAGPDGIRKIPARFAMPLAPVPAAEETAAVTGGDSSTKPAAETPLADYLFPFSDIGSRTSQREKLYRGMEAPSTTLFRLTCPHVTPSSGPWNRTAMLCQIFFAPIVWTWAILVHGFPSLSPAASHLAFGSAVVLGGMLAVSLSLTTPHGQKPDYYKHCSALGFATAMAWVYVIAVEAVHALQAVGRVLEVSDAFLGITVLSAANSVGDLVANMAIAKAGMQAMCISACVGGPIFIILFGGGVASVLGNYLVASPYPLDLNLEIFVAGIFLLFTVVATLVYLVINHMQAGRNLGVMLVMIYGAFICSVVGLEMVGGTQLVQQRIAAPR